MSNDYQIGLGTGSLVNLVDDPFSKVETEQVGFTLAGNPINVAMDTITWKWKNMSQEAWNQIYTFWTTNIQAANPPPYVYIRSLNESGSTFTYSIYRCRMAKPISEVNVTIAQVRDGTLVFYQCELVA